MRVYNQILSNLRIGELNESDWKRLSGKKSKFMDQKYQKQIMYKLIPVLNAYDIEMFDKAYNKGPGKQTYIGFDSEGNRIMFVFSNDEKYLDPYDKTKWGMFLRIYYKGKVSDVGMIDLSNTDNLNKSFALITQTLEDMGFKLKEDPKEKEEAEEDPDIKTLIDYKNSLSESELLDLEADYE